jgi:predicted HicB family RNase H-like nuclease
MADEQKRLTVDIPAELHRQAKIRAAERGVDLRVIVIEALEQAVMRKPPRRAR